MCTNMGETRFVLLKPPAKVLDMHEQEIMLSKARLKILGIILLNNVKKYNALKIRGVKGSILLDLFPKRGARTPWDPWLWPCHGVNMYDQGMNVLVHHIFQVIFSSLQINQIVQRDKLSVAS